MLIKQGVPIKLCAVCSDIEKDFFDCQKVLCVIRLTAHFNGDIKWCENIDSQYI